MTIQTDEISGAVVSSAALDDGQAHFVGISFVARQAFADRFAVDDFAHRAAAASRVGADIYASLA